MRGKKKNDRQGNSYRSCLNEGGNAYSVDEPKTKSKRQYHLSRLSEMVILSETWLNEAENIS